MSNKINNQIPQNTVIGARQLTREFAKLSLGREAMDYLNGVGGTFQLNINGNTGAVSHRIIDDEGKHLCTTRELETVAGYKKFIMDKKDENETNQLKDTGIMTLFHLKGQYEVIFGEGTCPDRMLEANISKFGQLKKDLETVLKNLEVIGTLPPSCERIFLIGKGTVIKRILIKALVLCVGPNKLEQTFVNEMFLGCCIPAYLRTKFIDLNFTKNVKNDATILIFPKGNHVKTIGLTTAEARRDSMLRNNSPAILHSGAIVELARSDQLRDWFVSPNGENTEELLAQYDKLVWPMLAPGGVDEYLKPRTDRVNVKSFTPTLAPRPKVGEKKAFRPETPFQREVRELKNLHGKFVSTMLDFYHFIPKVDNPLEDFWNQAFPDTEHWDISPEMTIYHWIEQAPRKDVILEAIRNNTMLLFKRKLAHIVGTALDIPSESFRFRTLRGILSATGANVHGRNYTDNPNSTDVINDLPVFQYEDVTSTANITGAIRDSIAAFRGKPTEELQAGEKRQNLIAKKKLNKTASKWISKINDADLREPIRKWVTENFRNPKLQNLAAEYVTTAIEDENLGYDSSESESSSSEEDE